MYVSVLHDARLHCDVASHCIVIGRDRVDLASLYKHVVPCITDWEDLGVHLGLKPYHLDCISRDNEYTPNRTRNCCRAVLKKWLELECSPTWVNWKMPSMPLKILSLPTMILQVIKLLNKKLSTELVNHNCDYIAS